MFPLSSNAYQQRDHGIKGAMVSETAWTLDFALSDLGHISLVNEPTTGIQSQLAPANTTGDSVCQSCIIVRLLLPCIRPCTGLNEVRSRRA